MFCVCPPKWPRCCHIAFSFHTLSLLPPQRLVVAVALVKRSIDVAVITDVVILCLSAVSVFFNALLAMASKSSHISSLSNAFFQLLIVVFATFSFIIEGKRIPSPSVSLHMSSSTLKFGRWLRFFLPASQHLSGESFQVWCMSGLLCVSHDYSLPLAPIPVCLAQVHVLSYLRHVQYGIPRKFWLMNKI